MQLDKPWAGLKWSRITSSGMPGKQHADVHTEQQQQWRQRVWFKVGAGKLLQLEIPVSCQATRSAVQGCCGLRAQHLTQDYNRHTEGHKATNDDAGNCTPSQTGTPADRALHVEP